jgi:hypothetical protein
MTTQKLFGQRAARLRTEGPTVLALISQFLKILFFES